MANTFDTEFALILRHTAKITRRSGYTTTEMGDRRPTGETVITANASVYFDYYIDSVRYGGKYTRDQSGDFRNIDGKMYMRSSQDVQEGDWIYPVIGGPVGVTLGRVLVVKGVPDFDGNTHHLEVYFEKLG